MMVEELDCLWALFSILTHLFHVLRKAFSMTFFSNTSLSQPPLSWKKLADMPVSAASKMTTNAPNDSMKKDIENSMHELVSKNEVVDKLKRFDGEELKADECSSVAARKLRSRPAKIEIPQSGALSLELGEVFRRKDEDLGREMEAEGNGYWLASRRGTRHRMEDGYMVITNIHEDSKQALFGVFDGHGGRAAVDFVSEKLGKNIINALEEVKEDDNEEEKLESAIESAYLTTDGEFLSQGVGSGTCVVTVLLKNGNLYASNAGDCRVVMSKNGVAHVLTSDHHPEREDERTRIENLGGYVSCYNGVWRVQETLAVSRAIGDASIKKWIISEPETRRIQLNQDCEFLIMASDGLWDKVSNQEAVDVVKRRRNSIQSCRELVEISCSRGNRDDVTVMVVDLRSFCAVG